MAYFDPAKPRAPVRRTAASTDSDKRGFLGRLGHDIRTIAAAVPRLPNLLLGEGLALLSGPTAHEEGSIARNLADSDIPFLSGVGKTAVKRTEQFGKTYEKSKSKGLRGRAGAILSEGPGVTMIPGTYTLGEIAKGTPGELAKHPGYTALDLIPGVGKAVKVGTKAGGMAAKAAEGQGLGRLPGVARTAQAAQVARGTAAQEARVLGKIGRAAEMEQRGLTIPQAARTAGKAVERSIGERYPHLTGFMPTQLLERSGIGGVRLRRGAEIMSIEGRKLAVDLERQVNRLEDIRKSAGLDHDRVRELTKLAEEGAPGWRQRISPDEQRFVREYEGVSDELRRRGVQSGELFAHGGEWYAKSGTPHLAKAVERRNALQRQEARLTPRLTDAQTHLASMEAKAGETFNRRIGKVQAHVDVLDERIARATQQIEARRTGRPTKALAEAEAKLQRAIAKRDQVQGLANEWVRRRDKFVAPARARVQKLEGRRRFLSERAKKFGEQADRLAVNTPPAKFMPRINAQLREMVAQRLNVPKIDLDDPLWGRVLRDLEPTVPVAQVEKWAKQIMGTWQTMRDQGVDPVYYHHVPTNEAERLLKPPNVVRPLTSKPADLKARSWDLTSYVPDWEVGLTAQALDWLQNDHSLAVIAQMKDAGWIKTGKEMAQAAQQQAEREVARKLAKGMSEGQAQRFYIKRVAELQSEWRKFEPDSIFSFKRDTKARLPGDMYVPTPIAKLMDRSVPKDLSKLQKGAEAGQDLFRLSVLTLNPAYYMGNFVSDMVLVSARQSPLALRHSLEAWRMIKEGRVPLELGRGWAQAGKGGGDTAVWNFRVGKEMADLVRETPSGWGRFKEMGRQGTTMMQAIVETIDDMGKVVAYLDAEKKAIKKGLTGAEARSLAVEKALKVLPGFDRMLPFERTVLRQVAPFYSWWKFMNQFVLSYPFDHPLRAAMISSLARHEYEDWQTGIPERFMNYLYMGQPDAEGNQSVYPLGGFFPFMSVANNATLAGFLGQLDPRIEIALQQMGVDPITYGPDLYPDIQFDPVSGRETMLRPPLGRGVLEALVPQAGRLMSRFAPTADEERLREEYPEAYERRAGLAGLVGLRGTSYNLEEEAAKTEKAKGRVAADEARRARQAQKTTTTKTARKPSGDTYTPFR